MNKKHPNIVDQAYKELLACLPEKFNRADKKLVKEAFLLAKEAHKTQMRDTGLPYILHPLAVAQIVVKEMRQQGAAVVAAALLHDVVEDTEYSIEDIRSRFGDDVAFLVNAVTKPNKQQVDNFQHILASVEGDVRVLVLKLSDRLHNMRTLGGLRPQKQWKIASETQFFFAPLAGRLGLFKVKSELENLAFSFLNPNEYAYIEKALEEDKERTKDATEAFMYEALHTVGKELDDAVGWDIRYRKPYSIWREMHELSCDFYHVPFKHYIRAVFHPERVRNEFGYGIPDEVDVAMKIYATLAASYREQTGSFVNFMLQPKSNGYRSLHVRFLNPHGGYEEFHISSEDMREQSYYGCVLDNEEQWLKRLTDVLRELSEDPESLMPGIHDSLYNEDVVVFTPKSEPISLPKGSTALDFAYAVHSDVGNHAKYARINGRLASVNTELKRGDCVEIGTEDSIHPKSDWLDAVVSYKAKKHIRSYLNKLPKQKYEFCPHCHPLPGSEIIGFEDSEKRIILHSRNCSEAIRMASEKGNMIVAVEDFEPCPDCLYPVKIDITGIDRYHLLQDILDCIVEKYHLPISSLSTMTRDNIVTCSIEFSVHSADELKEISSLISDIDKVEEVKNVYE